jgi:polysaccharide biosynthesis protein PslH
LTKATFLLSKDPVLQHAGDIEMSRITMQLAAEAFEVSALCLSPESGSVTADFVPGGVEVVRIEKPSVAKAKMLATALRKNRSLVHVRFDVDELVTAIDQTESDVFVAEHSYMAESFLRSTHFGHRGLVVDSHVPESLVWRAMRSVLGRIEGPRLVRDELRVARASGIVGTHDIEEAEIYSAHGIPLVRWLDVTIPPAARQIDVSATGKRLVFLGVRDWPPNQEGFLYALQLWPRIAEGIPDAELCIVGPRKPGASDPVYPPGVRDLGFVDDLGAFLNTCRALIAPIKTGGGVRVKILDAISKGLPVVGTTPAVGSLSSLFDLSTFDDDESFIAECRRLLLDRDAAARAGTDLYESNRQHWLEKRPHRSVQDLLLAGARV